VNENPVINIHKKFEPLFKFPKEVRYFILTGGRFSFKSFTASIAVCIAVHKENRKALYTRYTLTAAKDSIIPEFEEKIQLLGFDEYYTSQVDRIIGKENREVVFKGIKTSSGNQSAKLKSLKGFSIFVLDEAEEENDEVSFDKINFSIRELTNQNIVILILNPTTKEHWIYKRFFESRGVQEGFNGIKDDVTYIHTTYLDNYDNLDISFINEVERIKETNPNKYQHQILGGWLNKAEGVVYSNWSIGKFEEHSKVVFGQDYGFSVDPTTLDKVSIDKVGKRIFVKECFHKTGLTTSQIFEENKKHVENNLIVADSAEPRLIAELKTRGLNIKGISKPQIIDRVALMQDYEIVVDSESINIIKELNNYIWHDRKSQTPIDDYNHHLDTIGYVLWDLIGKPNKGKYYTG